MRGDFWVPVSPVGKEVGDSAGVVSPAGELAGKGARDRWGEALVLPAPVDQLPVESAAAGLVEALGVTIDVSREVSGDEVVVVPWGPVVEVFVGGGRNVLFYQHR